MASAILSESNKHLVNQIHSTARRLTDSRQDCQSHHMHSSALAFLRHIIAQAQKRDPGDLTWKNMFMALNKAHLNLAYLCTIHVDRGLSMAQAYKMKGSCALCGMLEVMVRTKPQASICVPVLHPSL